ncbi:TonB-dependent receptor [Hephaestia mangrovi]|uniref:TonB-dependent receptor n=1 Tax=Hephaestia mangrovi TaxID=2873268 RepID=UPI001CA63877|nr:TonB-dependent receptor [Hephaestia mangrovi]MBY8827060.1 TonB-dependent receptor [Hephaestia mangrovi]
MHKKLYAGVAFAALMIPGAAYAQSTGTLEFEKGDIVVTGTRSTDVAGVKIPDTGKTRVELTNKFFSHETAGQSVDEMINMLPGVSFNSYDGYGSSGGSLSIRGFDASRILQTVDGLPLNDTGNYAIYSNQQIDPELIDQVNVTLGSVDIDSPSASASGSTVAYTTIVPTDNISAQLKGSIGDQDMFRVFGLFNTGVFTPWGTKAWISATHQDYRTVYNPKGKIRKAAYNAKIYQPIGSNGDFISIAGNYNVNRNNNTTDVYFDEFPLDKNDRDLQLDRCQVAAATPGVQDNPNKCGTNYAEGLNPSNTGNIRIASSFHLADNIILTVDPSFSYVKANGGGNTVTGTEGASPDGLYGYIGNKYYFGEDLNGDGDLLDTVSLHAPSQTVTHRYTITSSLLWKITDGQSVRIAYTHDYGRHRQSGQVGYLLANGQAKDPFPINDPITAANGAVVNKRDRKSFAILDKVGAEYRGNFLNDALRVDLGVSYAMMKRNLHQYCFTTGANGYVDCVAGDAADQAAYAAANPDATGPVDASLTYNKFLPAANVTYNFTPAFQIYASYSKGEQVPGTDNLYQALYFYGTDQFVNPTPETTDNFDAGLRYTSSKIQAQVGPWLTIFQNRLASSYDPITDTTTYRNLGTVHKYGIDGSVSYQPIKQVSLYAFGSWLKSEIQDNVQTGVDGDGNPIYVITKGKRESGAPVYTLGGRIDVDLGPVRFGVEAKRTGKRYLNDQNVDLIYTPYGGGDPVNLGKTSPAYNVVNADARLNLGWAGLNDKTWLQFNVTNLFDVVYPGSFGGALAASNDPFTYIGAPRTMSATLNVQF